MAERQSLLRLQSSPLVKEQEVWIKSKTRLELAEVGWLVAGLPLDIASGGRLHLT